VTLAPTALPDPGTGARRRGGSGRTDLRHRLLDIAAGRRSPDRKPSYISPPQGDGPWSPGRVTRGRPVTAMRRQARSTATLAPAARESARPTRTELANGLRTCPVTHRRWIRGRLRSGDDRVHRTASARRRLPGWPEASRKRAPTYCWSSGKPSRTMSPSPRPTSSSGLAKPSGRTSPSPPRSFILRRCRCVPE
jgi:hypothetical protein